MVKYKDPAVVADVLSLDAIGVSTKRIAAALGCSIGTVERVRRAAADQARVLSVRDWGEMQRLDVSHLGLPPYVVWGLYDRGVQNVGQLMHEQDVGDFCSLYGVGKVGAALLDEVVDEIRQRWLS